MGETERRKFIRIPGVPDIDEMEQALAEVKSGTLSPDERARKEQFLLEGAAAIQKAIPTETLVSLTEGVQGILANLQARRQAQRGEAES